MLHSAELFIMPILSQNNPTLINIHFFKIYSNISSHLGSSLPKGNSPVGLPIKNLGYEY